VVHPETKINKANIQRVFWNLELKFEIWNFPLWNLEFSSLEFIIPDLGHNSAQPPFLPLFPAILLVTTKCPAMKLTILAPIDFSSVSMNAARYAAHFAREIHADLKLLHIVQMPVIYGEVPMPIGNYEHIVDEAHEQMQALVRNMNHEFEEAIFIHYEVRAGSPVYEIAEVAEKEHPLVLVLGTRGLGNLERFLLGSVTLSLIKESPVPVLVVPEFCGYEKIRKLGFASDLINVVENTPDKLIRKMTELLDAELFIIHNDPNYHEYEPVYMEEEMLLDTMFAQQKHSFHFLHAEITEASIVAFAKENNLDWLMILPRRHGFFDELFGHQHTRQFVLHAELPVLVLPVPE
jgi:nucleotide-binding universal stress UspA family protein